VLVGKQCCTLPAKASRVGPASSGGLNVDVGALDDAGSIPAGSLDDFPPRLFLGVQFQMCHGFGAST
jgi:hypothetical protein